MGEKLDRCPHCGGDSGFSWTLPLEMCGSWGSEAEASGRALDKPYPSFVRCADCGRRVGLCRASGRAAPSAEEEPDA